MTRDERNPVTDEAFLQVPEVGDLGSFEAEPEGGDPDAPEPELDHSAVWGGPGVADDDAPEPDDRLDLTADDPPEQAAGYSTE